MKVPGMFTLHLCTALGFKKTEMLHLEVKCKVTKGSERCKLTVENCEKVYHAENSYMVF
jgi:hypothetical protein